MLMRRTVFNAPLDRQEMARYQRAHERIFLAMTKGDAESAAELLTTHMRRVTDNVRRAGPSAHQDGKAAAI
jgi:DNA-binding GntR family transcriptional regulator